MKLFGSLNRIWTFAAVVSALVVAISAAQAAKDTALVRNVQGSADYSSGDGSWKSLSKGRRLSEGTVVRTGADSYVDLYMRHTGPVVRITENTELQLDEMTYEPTGVETIITTRLDLKSGRILGYVAEMADASKYEVETPRGIAGIRGTEYDISADGVVTVVSGTVVMVTEIDGQIVSQVVNAGETFDAGNNTLNPTDPSILPPLQDFFRQVPEIIPGPVAPPAPPIVVRPPKDIADQINDSIPPIDDEDVTPVLGEHGPSGE